MATPTYVSLAQVELTSTDSSITFSNLPTSFRDLVITMNIKATGSATEPRLKFNSDSSNEYDFVQMSAATSALSNGGTSTSGWLSPNTSVATTGFDLCQVEIFDYVSSNKFKTYLSQYAPSTEDTHRNQLIVNWNYTQAITSIEVLTLTNAFAIGSTFEIYGIEA